MRAARTIAAGAYLLAALGLAVLMLVDLGR
jgi:hypothetical protein